MSGARRADVDVFAGRHINRDPFVRVGAAFAGKIR